MSLDAEPCPTVMGGGLSAFGSYWIEDDGRPVNTKKQDKPPYAVPSMDSIRKATTNGFKVVSTFSGCGGSCLGYRMAGFEVVWANEFMPHAQASYKANHDSHLDTRDIKTVEVADIFKATGLAEGELDLFDGSPPCQAFSTAGKRHKNWGKAKDYNGTKQCNESMFDEYVRLLRGLMPRVFVAENVSGLVKGVAKGYFLEILAALKTSGYKVKAQVLDAQWLGVPQVRKRVIFVGVRNDVEGEPVFPKPLAYRYSVRDALPWIESVDMGGGFGSVSKERAGSVTYQTIGTSPSSGNGLATSVYSGAERRKFTIDELKRICGFPDDFKLVGTYAKQWSCLGNSVPPVMMSHIAVEIRDRVLT